MLQATPVAVLVALALASMGVTALSGIDQDGAVSALLPGVSSCQAAASEGRCEEMNSGVAFLCQQSCASTFDGACDDQDAAVALAWEAGLSHTLGVQVGMNCARTRAALQCNTEPFASLCPATCLRCIDNKLAAEYGGDMASDVALQFQYQDEVVANEIRVAEYDCALRRRDSGFDCTVADEQCPEF